ncbi:MAG: Protein TolB [Candidatus Hinthialibacteria bacterium OLB16]|nr:MAG: Protein TolB [Candidatus Hinthialibacteria bacterium OLB16]
MNKQRINRIAAFCLLAAFGMIFLAEASLAQEPRRAVRRFSDREASAEANRRLVIEGSGGQSDLLQVAIADLQVTGGADNDLQVQYDKTMRYDLEFSDYFEPIQNNSAMIAQHRQDMAVRAIDYTAWQNLDCAVLIKGEFQNQGNQGNIRLYAYDVYDEKSLNALEYTIQFDSNEKKRSGKFDARFIILWMDWFKNTTRRGFRAAPTLTLPLKIQTGARHRWRQKEDP